MRVSVVIPCFKDSATLARALDSVLGQSRPVDEIILVNDSSPEVNEIETILRSYPQVRYIVNTHNIGLAATRNVGVAAATGDVISFLDADDELHPQKIEFQLAVYRSDRAIACDVERIGDERGVGRVVSYSGKVKYSVCRSTSRYLRRNLLVGASLMISRNLFLSLGGYDEDLRSCEDFDFWLRILEAGVLVLNINLPLYLYRINEAGLSRNHLNISKWELVVVNKHIMRLKQRGEQMKDEALIMFVWLFRHSVRYEQCRDHRLLEAINLNMALLDRWPWMQKSLTLLREIGLTRLVANTRLVNTAK